MAKKKKYPDGGPIPSEKVSDEWLKNWYAQRAKNPIFKDKAENAYGVIPHINTYDMTKLPMSAGDRTIAYSNGVDIFIDPQSPASSSSITNIHEKTHVLDNYFNLSNNNIFDNNINLPSKNKNIIHGRDYMQNNQLRNKEAYSELNEFRYKNNIDPNKTYSIEDVKEIMKKDKKDYNPSIGELYQLINDNPEKLTNLLNGVVKTNSTNYPTAKNGAKMIKKDKKNPLKAYFGSYMDAMQGSPSAIQGLSNADTPDLVGKPLNVQTLPLYNPSDIDVTKAVGPNNQITDIDQKSNIVPNQIRAQAQIDKKQMFGNQNTPQIDVKSMAGSILPFINALTNERDPARRAPFAPMEVYNPHPNGTGSQALYENGGPIAYNPNLSKKDKGFQKWYGANTLEGQRGVPFSENLDYDYYSFYRNKGEGNIEDHFPDTYKRPIHETFSNESIYSTPENPGGSWKGEKYIPAKKGKKAQMGMELEQFGDPVPYASTLTNSSQNMYNNVNALLSIGGNPMSSAEGKALLQSKESGNLKKTRALIDNIGIYNQRPDVMNMSPEQRVENYYQLASDNADVADYKQSYKNYGSGPTSSLWNSPSSNKKAPSSALAKQKDGGKNKAFWGAIAGVAQQAGQKITDQVKAQTKAAAEAPQQIMQAFAQMTNFKDTFHPTAGYQPGPYVQPDQMMYDNGGEIPIKTPTTNLDPVTVHGFKKKSTRDYYKQLQDYSPESYAAMIKMGEKHGFSTIQLNDGSEKAYNIGKAGANYDPRTNTINVFDYKNQFYGSIENNPIDNNKSNDYILDEMGHKKQFDNNRINSYTRGALDQLKSIFGNINPYDNPGSIEYNAHKEIAPLLKREYEGYRGDSLDDNAVAWAFSKEGKNFAEKQNERKLRQAEYAKKGIKTDAFGHPIKMDNGGEIGMGNQITLHDEGSTQMLSYNPYDGGTMQLNGPSHEEGGIDMSYGGNRIEAEGQETGVKDAEGNLHIMGNMKVPGSNTKFKQVSKKIAEQEEKYEKLKTEGSSLVKLNDPEDKWQRFKFNAGTIMAQGGDMGQKDLAKKKNELSSLQSALLATAEEFNVSPEHLSNGEIKKAKKGTFAKAANGWVGDPVPKKASVAVRNNNPGNIKFGDFAKRHGAVQGDPATDGGYFAKFPDAETGLNAIRSLLQTKTYKNLPVDEAIKKWTNGTGYHADLSPFSGKSIKQLKDGELDNLVNTITYGEDGKYYTRNSGNIPSRGQLLTPTPTAPSPAPVQEPFSPYALPNTPFTYQNPIAPTPGIYTPPQQEILQPQAERALPSNAKGLSLGQILPELTAAGNNQLEPVNSQHYNPLLEQPYQVSFQDRMNANQSTFNALTRQINTTSPTALSTLSAQKYNADSSVLADEFRTNQAEANRVYNGNRNTLNDAQLKNLAIDDTQYTRQAQAKSNTKAQGQAILSSIAGKYLQNRLNNQRLAIGENFYNYRQDENGKLENYNPDAQFDFSGMDSGSNSAPYTRTRQIFDNNGQVKQSVATTPSAREQRLIDLKIQKQEIDKPKINISKLFKGLF